MTPIWKATGRTIALLEGVTEVAGYGYVAAAKLALGKPRQFVLSMYEYCQWRGCDYDTFMLDVKANKLRNQFIRADDIAAIEKVTRKTGYNRLKFLREHFKYAQNNLVTYRDYASYTGSDLDALYNRKKLYSVSKRP